MVKNPPANAGDVRDLGSIPDTYPESKANKGELGTLRMAKEMRQKK